MALGEVIRDQPRERMGVESNQSSSDSIEEGVSGASLVNDQALDRYTAAYETRRPGLVTFTGQVTSLLKTLLNQVGFAYQSVNGRCKEVNSYREKIRRKQYTDPDKQLMDAVGVRAVMYYDADVTHVAELIVNEFDVDEANSGPRCTASQAKSGSNAGKSLVPR